MNENKTSKYFKYAIGEIILVVIGILIALQINTWNENRNLKKLEVQYLTGILNDLKADASLIDEIIRPNYLKHDKNHLFLDSLVSNNIIIQEHHLPMVWSPQVLTKSGLGFYPKVGNYNAMISEGKSGLIKDRDLFAAIQQLYEVWHVRNMNFLKRRNKIIDEIRAKHSYIFNYGNKLDNLRNKELLADLRFMYEYKRSYFSFLERGLEANLHKVITKIENQTKGD